MPCLGPCLPAVKVVAFLGCMDILPAPCQVSRHCLDSCFSPSVSVPPIGVYVRQSLQVPPSCALRIPGPWRFWDSSFLWEPSNQLPIHLKVPRMGWIIFSTCLQSGFLVLFSYLQRFSATGVFAPVWVACLASPCCASLSVSVCACFLLHIECRLPWCYSFFLFYTLQMSLNLEALAVLI